MVGLADGLESMAWLPAEMRQMMGLAGREMQSPEPNCSLVSGMGEKGPEGCGCRDGWAANIHLIVMSADCFNMLTSALVARLEWAA